MGGRCSPFESGNASERILIFLFPIPVPGFTLGAWRIFVCSRERILTTFTQL